MEREAATLLYLVMESEEGKYTVPEEFTAGVGDHRGLEETLMSAVDRSPNPAVDPRSLIAEAELLTRRPAGVSRQASSSKMLERAT